MSFILLGEFDIDEGSILKHEYPRATGANEHLLAELMLPDGAHSRSEDWTIFYLNQTAAVTVTSISPTEGETDSLNSNNGEKDKPGRLLYVLNLVRTKKDEKVRRGALVKALAICTTEPYVQIYKPLLLLALEDYFNNPCVDVLANLYNSVKAIDLSRMPSLSFSERLILRCSERKDLFEDRFLDSTGPTATDLNTSVSPAYPIEAILPSPPISESGIETATRANRSFSESTRKGSVTSFETSSSGNPLDRSNGSNSTWVRPRIPSSGGTTTSSLKRPELPTYDSGNATNRHRPRDTHFYETKVTYNNINLPIRIPIGIEEDEVGDYSLINLLQTFNPSHAHHTFAPPFHPHLHTSGAATPPIILLFNALITGKRIVFLGSSLPANQVVHLVLAACALGSGGGSGLLKGFTERCFPYSNLTNRDNHEAVAGYIAGVTNPRFEAFTQSYDVFCNIDTGRITVSKDIAQDHSHRSTPPSTINSMSIGLQSTSSDENPVSPTGSNSNSVAPWEDVPGPKAPNLNVLASGTGTGQSKMDTKDNSDALFMEEIHHLLAARVSETVIRSKFSEYLWRFLRIASKYEEEIYGSTTIGWLTSNYNGTNLGSGTVLQPENGGRELIWNASRIEGWRVTNCYQLFRQDVRDRLANSSFKQLDLAHQLAKLRYTRNLARAEVDAIFTTLARSVRTDAQIIELLSYLPPHNGGLLPLAFGLFSSSSITREATVELFMNIESNPIGSKFIASLNTFHKLAFGRLVRERNQAQEEGVSAPGRAA